MKKILALALSAMMVLGLASCGSGGDQKDAPAESNAAAENESGESAADAQAKGDSNDHHKIKVILKTEASEYWQYVIAGVNAYAKDHPNVEVEVSGPPSETSYEEQLQMIETSLAVKDYDGFVISPLQADMVAQKIQGETRPIVAVDTKIEAPEVMSFVGTGNLDAGELGGKAAVEAAKAAGWDKIEAINIAGVQGDTTSEDRMAGYKKGIEESGGTFLDAETQYAEAVADKAVASMEAIMQNHPEGVAIITANNDDMAMAAARAAKSNPAFEKTIFMGFDGIQSACNAILSDDLTMSVSQQAYEMGYNSVDSVVKALNGEKLEAFVDSGASVVTKDNAQERLDQLKGYLGQ